MAEHLAILSPRALRRVGGRRVLVWRRRRREAPIGRVQAGDRVFMKLPGGLVVSVGTVGRVREERREGQYILTLKLRRFERLAVPFPVIKRDRRSWVVCARSSDDRQLRLLAERVLSVPDFLKRLQDFWKPLPSRRALRSLLAALARDPSSGAPLLLWLAFLVAAHESEGTPAALEACLKRPSYSVFPFAAFSRVRSVLH